MKRQLGILAGMAALAAILFFRPGEKAGNAAPAAGSESHPAPPVKLLHSAPHRNDDTACLPTVEPEDPVLLHLRELTEAVTQTDPDKTEAAWDTLVNSFAMTDIPRILNQLINTKDGSLVELRQLLVRRWAAADPASAAAWAIRLSDPAVQKGVLEQVAVIWFQNNSAEAVAWAERLPAGEGKTAVIVNLGYELARVKPAEALRLAGTLPPGKERDAMVVHGVSQWAATDPAAAACWAVQIPDENLRHQVLADVCTAWAGRNPSGAASFAVNYLPPGAEQDRAVVSIIQRWAQTAPAAAAMWVEQLPAAQARTAALQNLVTAWTEQTPEAAAVWLKSLPSGPLRDEGIAVFAQMTAPLCFQYAQAWASSIEDAARRALCEEAIRRVSMP